MHDLFCRSRSVEGESKGGRAIPLPQDGNLANSNPYLIPHDRHHEQKVQAKRP